MASLASPTGSTSQATVLYVGRRVSVVAAAAERCEVDLRNATAVSRREALEQVDAAVDCLVVDASLAGASGTEFLAEVRRAYPELSGVVLVDSDDVPEMRSQAPTDYARVADGPESLATRIRNVLARETRTDGLADHLFGCVIRDAPNPIVVVDDRAEVRFANDAVAGVFGYAPDSLVGSPVTDLVPAERREPFLDGFARHVVDDPVGGWCDTTVYGRHRNGEEIPLSLSVHQGRYGDEPLFTAIVRDVNERREREVKLEQQRDELAELDRINHVIREVARALVNAASRSEIERAVCDRLAESGPYKFGWLGRENLARNTVIPRVEAGAGDGYLEAVTPTDAAGLPDRAPAAQAVRDRSVTVVGDVATDERFEPWREAALDSGLRSAAVVPIRYEETVFGVLALYEGEADAFDDRETAVLEELGRMIGHAMTAVNRKEALVADERIELEFRLTDDEHFFTGLTADRDVSVTFDGMTPRTNGADLVYTTVHGGTPDAVRSAADADDVVDATLVQDQGDRCRFEFATTDDTVAATLASYGARVESMTATDGTARITAALSATADVRSLVEAVTAEFDGMELVAQREHRGATEDDGSPDHPVADLLDLLTDRQEAVLETAYRSGYFEWPRDRTAEEVADSLDVSSPTLHNHLRLAQGALFGALFDGS